MARLGFFLLVLPWLASWAQCQVQLPKIAIPKALDIGASIEGQAQSIGSVLALEPGTKFSTLFPDISAYTSDQLAKCYNSTVGNGHLDLFNSSVLNAIQAYYANFPENFDAKKLPQKVTNLYQSMRKIAQHTLACLETPTSYQLGMTPFSDWSDSQFKKLMGSKDSFANIKAKFSRRKVRKNKEDDEENDDKESNDDDEGREEDEDDEDESRSNKKKNKKPKNKRSKKKKAKSDRLVRVRRADEAPIDPKCIPSDKSPLPEMFDWREKKGVTPVKFQDECGSCWTFASIASLESAYLIKGKTADVKFDLSEQQLLACGVQDACESGGTAVDAFNFILDNFGVTSELEMPYDFTKAVCNKKAKKKRSARIKDYCLRGIYVTVDGKPEELSDADIQYAIREYGPVYTTIDGEDDEVLKHFKSGLYANPKCSKETNHAVNIVGWDKEAWIVKNSWGEKWGERGFFRLKKGENMCGVNTYISYTLL